MKIVNVYRGFKEYGGAETVLLNIHFNLKKLGYESYVSGPHSYVEVNDKYNIPEEDYVRLSVKNITRFHNAVVISHHRKTTTFLYQVKLLPTVKFRLINVAHNEFFNLKQFTFLPVENISVSQRVKDNLVSFFNVNSENVRVIYNGLEDKNKGFAGAAVRPAEETEKIKILYPGRITKVKRQVEVLKELKGNLPSHIEIHFAGVGEELELLKSNIDEDNNFKTLGFVSMTETLPGYDYVMLFSTNEGLPLTLIEGCMFGKPIICNDVGGNMEILEDGYNGFAAKDFKELIEVINILPSPSEEEYQRLSENSRKTYEVKFQMERMIQEYIDVINNSNNNN